MSGIVLRTEGLTKTFNQNIVLNHVDLQFDPGEIHILVGENGAGKSTLLKLIMGVHKPDSGSVFLNDQECILNTPLEAKKHAMAMVYQELSLLPEMSVLDNVFLGSSKDKNRFINKKNLNEEFLKRCCEYGIDLDPEELVKNLSLSKQLMVEVLKALVTNPDVIIFDEATSALDNEEVKVLFNIIYTLKKHNKTIIFISHRMDEVFRIGDRVTVLKDGEFVMTSPLAEIDEDTLIRHMVGRTIDEVFPSKSQAQEEVAFEIKGLSRKDGSLKKTNICIHKREVVGIAGLKGHGQDILLECIAGIRKYDTGRIMINGIPIKQAGTRAAIQAGIILVPEDRKTQALFLEHCLGKNLIVSSLDKRQTCGVIKKKAETVFIDNTISDLSIRFTSKHDPVSRLSGGNQQKIVLGRVLGVNPKVILFNEPTRGIDVQTKQEIFKRIRRLADSGVSVLLYSSDLLEVIGICDTVYTLYEGAVTRKLVGDQINEVEIMRGAVGNMRAEA